MFDAASTWHQRSRGELILSFKRRDGRTVLDGLRQDGCLKARFPRPGAADWAEAVTLNSSGGVAGGDALTVTVRAGPGTQAAVASQAAERFYRALPGTRARVITRLQVGPGAALDWLPQEAILFDRCALRRELRIDLAADARFLGVESLVFGRTAMGERVQEAELDDLIAVRREGKLALHDRTRLCGPVAALLERPAIGAGASAVATIIAAGPEVEAKLDVVREVLSPHDAGASAWDGMLLARITAPDGACLREAVVAGLSVLRGGRKLPRVWLC